MKTFFRDLKNAREASGVTLQHIADTTLINLHFLEALERGNDTILPQTYIRAFIREYAQVIGLNPDEVMRRYDESRHTADQPAGAADLADTPTDQSSRPRTIRLSLPTPAPEDLPDSDAPPAAVPSASRRGLTRWIVAAILVVAAGIVLYERAQRTATPPAQEIPFQSVIREAEKRTPPAATAPAPPAVPAPADSMTLRAAIADSVWVQIVIDREAPREYLFARPTRASWRARDRFLVTLGNAGAVQFTLNQREIGVLGRRGAVVRGVEINRQTLTQQPPR